MPAIRLTTFSIGSFVLRNGNTGFGQYWSEGGCNSAGGVCCLLGGSNKTGKTIKYATFAFEPYNAVGDVCKCNTTGTSVALIRLVGPIEPNGYISMDGKQVLWYNPTIHTAKILYVDLEFMDGTTQRAESSEVLYEPIEIKQSGCYVATAVYGSYDCPQVWTLRRYRDNILAKSWYGRAFIRTYYAISPTLVKWFGKTNWFKNMWKGKLDRMVKKLQDAGVENTPYNDKVW